MKKFIWLSLFLCVFQLSVFAADFETATQAVANMKVGWNLGNTLDAHAQSGKDVSSNSYWGQEGVESEVRWGQPKTTFSLLKMYRDAGFGAIRVPVTWYNHMDANGKVDDAWMARVKEVVDYVIDNGLYCILNVHHDTGADSDSHTSWLKAEATYYNNNKQRFEYLWKQIAETFRDYDEHLLFESYNEMLDSYSSWCFASFASQKKYDATVAASAYQAINSYAQSFVNTVRATGGNNAQRNLVVNTYGACCGEGTWNEHLTDPLKEMALPADQVQNHLIFEIHSYPPVTNLTETRKTVDDIISKLKTHLAAKGAPVIFGEWGTSTDNAYDNYRSNMAAFAKYFVEQTKAAGIGTFYWMGLTDGGDRLRLKWSMPEIKNAILKGWYGDDYAIPVDPEDPELIYKVSYYSSWQELNLYYDNGTMLNTNDYTGIRLELGETPLEGNLQVKVYGGADGKEQYLPVTSASQTFSFSPTTLSSRVRRVTLQYKKSEAYTITVTGAWLIKKDGTEVESEIDPFWGCSMEAIVVTGIRQVSGNTADAVDSPLYNLQGQRIREPQGGIYIRKGKKYIHK
jgi:aryl-phospho-beta-D-glucosidase BglC (GH1 family)